MYKSSQFTQETYKTGEVAEILNLHYQTVIRYDKEGRLRFQRTGTNRRVLFREDLLQYLNEKGLLIDDTSDRKRDVIYCRVSSHEQAVKGDLDRQVVKVLEYAQTRGLKNVLVLKEIGSGLNDGRKELQRLLQMVLRGEVNRIFINYKDRLTRFGYRYLETVCLESGVQICVVSEETKDKGVQEELLEDMMALIAGFSGKLYGMRSRNKKELRKKIEEIPTLPDEEGGTS